MFQNNVISGGRILHTSVVSASCNELLKRCAQDCFRVSNHSLQRFNLATAFAQICSVPPCGQNKTQHTPGDFLNHLYV